VYFPSSGEIAKRAPAAAGELQRGHGETVLLVDDEPMLVALNEELLAGLGYEPVGFTSSLAALEAFREDPGRFDAVLTDETMPDMVGTDFARALKDLRPEIPVVLMSGYSGMALARRAGEAGIREVLKKPLQLEDVASTLAAVLSPAAT
jgi:CheY-like chemotaxis protein